MTILVDVLSSISSHTMDLSRASSAHSYTSDIDSWDGATLYNPHEHNLTTAMQPGFHLFTSMIWIRQPACAAGDGNSTADPHNSSASGDSPDSGVLDHLQPDLGLLPFHRDRLAAAAEALQWRGIKPLERSEEALKLLRSSIHLYLKCLPEVPVDQVECRKLRLMVDRVGAIKVDSSLIDQLPLNACSILRDSFSPSSFRIEIASQQHEEPSVAISDHTAPCKVYLDTRSSKPSLFTNHKTTHRIQYNDARSRVKIAAFKPTDKEVLLYNKNREIMEASLCTVYFYRDSQWITPAGICGGNLGITRRIALEKGLCKQSTIEVDQLIDGELIWLSNAVRGFFLGQICLR